MPDFGGRLQVALDGYAKFLKDKDLTLPKQQPYLVRWVREFLLFAQEHSGYTFEQTLDMFPAEIGGRAGRFQPTQQALFSAPRAQDSGAVGSNALLSGGGPWLDMRDVHMPTNEREVRGVERHDRRA